MKKLEDVLGGSEQGGKLSDQSAKAKLEVVKELMSEMMGLLGSDVKSGLDELKSPVKQVTVAAPNEDLLKKGLETAQDLVPKMEGMDMGPKEHGDEEMDESHSEHMAEMKNPEMEKEEEPDDLYSMMQKKKKMMMGKA